MLSSITSTSFLYSHYRWSFYIHKHEDSSKVLHCKKQFCSLQRTTVRAFSSSGRHSPPTARATLLLLSSHTAWALLFLGMVPWGWASGVNTTRGKIMGVYCEWAAISTAGTALSAVSSSSSPSTDAWSVVLQCWSHSTLHAVIAAGVWGTTDVASSVSPWYCWVFI